MIKLLVAVSCFIIPLVKLAAQPTAANQLVITPTILTIPFDWKGDSINSTWEANAAMLIPVRLKNSPGIFYMQFDLGSPYSLLYKNKIDAIKARYPKSVQQNTGADKFERFLFNTGKSLITAMNIPLKQFDTTGINRAKKGNIEIIGTFGADLIDGKVAIIDYPHRKLTLTDTIPQKLSTNIFYSDFIYTNKRILLPSTIQGKQTILYFDTGSSMFELLTNKETCIQLATPDATVKQFKVESWGKFLTANTLASKESIEIANIQIPIHASSYIEGVSNSQVEQMMKMGIGGMTGNKLFLNYVLILDTKNRKFGLKTSTN